MEKAPSSNKASIINWVIKCINKVRLLEKKVVNIAIVKATLSTNKDSVESILGFGWL